MQNFETSKLEKSKKELMSFYVKKEQKRSYHKINLLVIDEDKYFLNFIKTKIEESKRYRYQIELFTDEYSIIENISNRIPDVILMDYHLSKCNAPTLERIINMITYCHIPVIFISSDKKALEKSGSHYKMCKPFHLDEFESIIWHIQNESKKVLV